MDNSIEKINLPEVWLVKPDQSFDYRGAYQTFFTDEMFHELTGEHIVEGNLVDNHQHTFRGYHYSPRSWKLYLCLSGVLHYWLVNWDESHPEYGEWQEFTLPRYYGFIKHPRYATGMWSITDSTLMVLQSQYYNASQPDQETIEKSKLNATLVANGKQSIFYPDLPMVRSERDTIGNYI